MTELEDASYGEFDKELAVRMIEDNMGQLDGPDRLIYSAIESRVKETGKITEDDYRWMSKVISELIRRSAIRPA